MKIAIITPFYYPSVGGTQTVVRSLSVFLCSKGDEVSVFASQAENMDEMDAHFLRSVTHSSPREIKEGVEIRRYAFGGALDFLLKALYALSYRSRLPFHQHLYNLYKLRAMRASRIVSDIVRFKPDAILIMPYTEPLVAVALAAGQKTGARLYIHMSLHLDSPNFTYTDSAFQKLKAFDAIMTNTDYARRFLVSRGLPESKIHVTGVGIDTSRPDSLQNTGAVDAGLQKKLTNKKYVLFLGRKQEGKGIETLIRAMEKVYGLFPESALVLAGVRTKYFDARVVPLMSGRSFVENVDAMNEATKQWLFDNAFIFSMVSNVDSFGIVYLEAWLHKKPVIGADLGATRCVIEDGQDGCLVPYGDTARLAEKIIGLLKNPDIAARMGEKGHEKVLQRFDERFIASQFFDLIHQPQ